MGMKIYHSTVVEFSKLFCICFLVLVGCAAHGNEKREINLMIQSVHACVHWAEEVGDQSAERNSEISFGIKRDCPPAEAALQKVITKYKNNKDVINAALDMFSIGRFQLTSVQKDAMCRAVKEHVGCTIASN